MEKISSDEREVLVKILQEKKDRNDVAKELGISFEAVKERFEAGFEKQMKYLDWVLKADSIDVYVASPFGKAVERNDFYFDFARFDINARISERIENMGFTTFSPACFCAERNFKGKLDTMMLKKCRSTYAVLNKFSFGTIEEVVRTHVSGKPTVMQIMGDDIYSNINGHTRRFCHYLPPKDFEKSFLCLEDALSGKEEFEYIKEERPLFNNYVVLKKCKRCGSTEPLGL